MIYLLQVIAISKGCAKPLDANEKNSPSRKALSRLNELICDEQNGALLAINSDLETSIRQILSGSENGFYEQQMLMFLRLTKQRHMRLNCKNIPIFAEEGNKIEDFSNVSQILIEQNEIKNTSSWNDFYKHEPHTHESGEVSIQRFDRLERRELNQRIAKGEKWKEFEDLMHIPIFWSQRIRLIDPYFILNSHKNASNSNNSTEIESALDRLIDTIIRIRKKKGTPLRELEIIVHHFFNSSNPKNSISFEETRNHVMASIAKFDDITKWIEKFSFRVYKNAVFNTKGKERLLIFEYSSSGFCFPATKGVVVDSDGYFKEDLEFLSPVSQKKCIEWKDSIRKHCELVDTT